MDNENVIDNKKIYSMNSSSRRVTEFVKSEARNWLFRMLDSQNCQYCTNGNKEADALIWTVRENRKISPDQYEQFISMYNNDLFEYSMIRKEAKKSKKITSDSLFCYFINFNGEILPLGFIKDFFEDDYETQNEIKQLAKEYLEYEQRKFDISSQGKLINTTKKIEKFKNNGTRYCVFHPSITFLITFTIQLIISVAMFVLFAHACKELHIVDIIRDLFNGVTEFSYSFSPDFVWYNEANISTSAFSIMDYLSTFGLVLAFLSLLFFVVIVRAIKFIKSVLFLIRLIWVNTVTYLSEASVSRVEEESVRELIGYFKDSQSEIIKNNFAISDDFCSNMPEARKEYLKVIKCDPTLRKMDKIIGRMANKRNNFLSFFYDVREHQKYIGKWISGLILPLLLYILFLITLLPISAIIEYFI